MQGKTKLAAIPASVRVSIAPAFVACLALGSYWSVRFAWADLLYRSNTLDRVNRAVELDSGNARYRAWQAELTEYEGGNPAPALLAAASLNPHDSATWIRLGLNAEMAGNYPRAENYLLQAVRVDQLSEPRVTLMHYYFRRGDWSRFWEWSRRALEMSYGDPAPLFRLCWTATQDASTVRRRAIPQRRDVLVKYLAFLSREDHLDAAVPVSREVLSEAGPNDARVLLEFCDRLLDRGSVEPALALWNGLCERKLTPYTPLRAGSAALLTNGDFANVPLLHGFDWRIPPLPEITAARPVSAEGLVFSLSGKQPERCELLWQYVPLIPGQEYRFRCRWRTSGIARPSGIRWRLPGAETRQPEGEDWHEAQTVFRSAGTVPDRVSLVCNRPEGAPRAEGLLYIRDVALEPVR